MMKALSVEKSILEGNNEVNDLFNFVKSNTHAFKAYDMEKEIFNRVMLIDLAAMKCYFAESETGNVGTDLNSYYQFSRKCWPSYWSFETNAGKAEIE